METIGIRELKTHASEILKRVREDGATYTVTHHGRAIARLTPIVELDEDRRPFASVEEMVAAFDALAEEIGRHLPPGATAEDAINDVRRDL